MDAEERFAPGQVHEFRHGDRLVYTWHQSVSSVYVQVPAPGMRAKDVVCQFSSRALVLGLKGNAPYMQGELCHKVVASECFWTLEDGEVHLQLQKMEEAKPWTCLLVGHDAADIMSHEADRKRLLLERFQAEHPGFDFSSASMDGHVPDASTFLRQA